MHVMRIAEKGSNTVNGVLVRVRSKIDVAAPLVSSHLPLNKAGRLQDKYFVSRDETDNLEAEKHHFFYGTANTVIDTSFEESAAQKVLDKLATCLSAPICRAPDRFGQTGHLISRTTSSTTLLDYLPSCLCSNDNTHAPIYNF